jgi:hypothetical protein
MSGATDTEAGANPAMNLNTNPNTTK